MHALPQDRPGVRIARLRRERHLTQRGLADLSGVPYNTLIKIEQGRLEATPHAVASLARAMRVTVGIIQGQPYADDLRADELDLLIGPIREALDVYDLGADPEVAARPLQTLSEESEALCEAVRGGEIKRVASDVAGLIVETTTAAHTHGGSDGWLVLASLYRTSYDVASKLGYADLAQLSLARLDWAAQRASDAVFGGAYQYFRALTYLREGQLRTGQRLIDLGLSTIEQAGPSQSRDVVVGQLHLGGSVVAGRDHDEAKAMGHLAEAERIANRIGESPKVLWMAFGGVNVGVHRVSVLAELAKYDKAVETANELAIPHDWPKSRTSHHWAEVAHAQMWMGKFDASFASLLRARKTAPQQAKYHPMVRETYASLEAARRRLPESFLSYGSWLTSQA
ncbi:helix-turn-helix domain-containing protein [Streptomyces microflavus]|uniref:Helix-turn-helix transcriptional regulator n=1 Tax=Streptomyces microflavus TaxID=1919 RepID=A0A7H8MY47_STRMI|nr:helix-turn-helix transcriptional regulator [Streptomyces microflavus]MBK3585919.1 helix-turn-helix transcriptional regulator [Streptomyces sp. MBT57]QKW47136.1 helix-turn-helix transcriptional regulator [Streptomyces microflavus]